jgi:hypothetical protein
MAKNRTAKHEARRNANESKRQDQHLAQRLAKVEHDVGEMRKARPMPPEQRANIEAAQARQAKPGERPDFIRVARGNADYGGPVEAHVKRLQGRSTSHVASDKDRGARSPLTHDETERRRRK